ncbi:MAG: hypothetical protein ISR64_09735 [Deltaproteobacteria bacterium]|nr:hypothetical protein [Deltaproteobacteria bacterium]
MKWSAFIACWDAVCAAGCGDADPSPHPVSDVPDAPDGTTLDEEIAQ